MCTMERWDSYYYSGSGTQSGASHVRYQQDSCQEGETSESEGYTSVYTSATERGAQSWSSSTPRDIDSEAEMSPPYSPLSFTSKWGGKNLMCLK